LQLGIGAGSEETRMMGLPDGRRSFKIGLAVLIQYRRVTDSQPPSQVAVASTRYAYLRRADKNYFSNVCKSITVPVKVRHSGVIIFVVEMNEN